MKVWTVSSSHSNESLDCEVFATEQEGLEGYLDAMGVPRDAGWDRLIALYWNDINAFDEWVEEYIEEHCGYSDMYRLEEHELAMPGVTPDPLYNEQGEQIREVTQSELDWTH